ncbi:hypothetical protein [Pedobacter agri]|uniref:Uncharacterized protein n=1 Tax=Pedobacter agri TaxID=454586 RepID=A0A9X3DF67_9SPHI|nr:hypothetical protein [Pedobacter agri]MCX3266539.1 hypothetical protein [Pedobacter agri]
MKWVKFKQGLLVEATNTLHKEGDVVEVSDEFAKRHGEKGTQIVEETVEPAEKVKLEKKPKRIKSEETKPVEPETSEFDQATN